MEKTKLGISVGLVGAALYFLGLISFIPLVLIAGYVLLREDNIWLRKTAVKAVVIVIGFNLLSILVGFGSDIFGVINYFVGLTPAHFSVNYPLRIDTLIRYILDLGQTLLLLVLGFKAFSQGSMKVGNIDTMIDKHMDTEKK